MPFLAYRDKNRANCPISSSLYPRNGIKQDRIDAEVIICFISQSGNQKISIIRRLKKEVSIYQNSDLLLQGGELLSKKLQISKIFRNKPLFLLIIVQK